jgi:hypothetical protein
MPKGPKGQKRPRDPNVLGKLIVDISVGAVEDRAPEGPPKQAGHAHPEHVSCPAVALR